MESPSKASDLPAWRLQCRRMARAAAVLSLVTNPILLSLTVDHFVDEVMQVLEVAQAVALGLGLLALPLGWLARPREKLGVAVGTVTWIIVLLAVLAINLPKAGIFGNRCGQAESMAMSKLRTINTAQITYRSDTSHYGTLDGLVAAGLLNPTFLEPVCYKFSFTTDGVSYTATAEPVTSNSGRYDYFSWPDGVVRYGNKAPYERLIGKPVQ